MVSKLAGLISQESISVYYSRVDNNEMITEMNLSHSYNLI